MAEEFVVVHDPLHEEMANLSRKTPLEPVFERRKSSPNFGKVEDIVHDVDGVERLASARYYELLDIPVFYDNGQPARTAQTLYIYDYFDANKVDKYCRDGLRSKITLRATSLFSVDLLNHGIGIVRRVRAWSGGFYAALGDHLGRIELNGAKVYQTIIAKTHTDPEDTVITHAEDWESTNIVYGDSYGEVQQIQDRKSDREFLVKLCEGLNLEPESQSFWTPDYKGLHKNHVACQRLWDDPPQSPDELVDRVDYILAHCVLDDKPKSSVRLHKISR